MARRQFSRQHKQQVILIGLDNRGPTRVGRALFLGWIGLTWADPGMREGLHDASIRNMDAS